MSFAKFPQSVIRAIKQIVLFMVLLSCGKLVHADENKINQLNWSNFYHKTHLISMSQGSPRSAQVSNLRVGGFELADGAPVSFNNWYSTNWLDFRVQWLTQVSNNFGVIWGVSTGESGTKYKISPSVILGFTAHHNFSKGLTGYITATTVLGGRLREKPCIANYGDVGGVQPVNCRLAATYIPPEETLRYLLNEKPKEASIRIKLEWTFD